MALPLRSSDAEQASWEDYVRRLTPQEACELLGVEHFPHWLASAANLLLLAQHLAARHGPDVRIRDALIAELKEGPHPPSGSENTTWWREIKPHLPMLEKVLLVFMAKTGNLPGHGGRE
ncbi:MAG: hypothetical protein ACOZHQ_17055 [Thermodesulfobacteriota bacterium]